MSEIRLERVYEVDGRQVPVYEMGTASRRFAAVFIDDIPASARREVMAWLNGYRLTSGSKGWALPEEDFAKWVKEQKS